MESHVQYVSNNNGSQASEAKDRFSALPDDILIDIVSRLDLRTTVRVGALSRRWRHIPRSLPVVTIDVCDALWPPCPLDRKLAAHAAATRWLLAPCVERTVRTLGLGFHLVEPYLQTVGRAVEDVAERSGLEYLQFTIWTPPGADLSRDGELLGQLFMSFFEACPVSFKCLTALELVRIRFSESAIPALLNTCTKLQYLSLTECDSGPASTVKMNAPNSDIRTLKLVESGYKTIELVNLPKLTALYCEEYYGYTPPVRFGNVPCLEIIYISFACLYWQEPFTLSEWLRNCRNLYNLSLNFQDDKIWIKPEGPSQLFSMYSNLRTVSLFNVSRDCNLNWTLFILEASPSITTFNVKISWHKCDRNKCEDSAEMTNVSWEASNFQHRNLALLQIRDFAVEKMVMEYIRKIIKLAPCLKRIRLLKPYPSEKCDSTFCRLWTQTRLRFPVDAREKNIIKERLADGLSTSVEISIE